MNRALKLGLGIATVLPLLQIAFFFAFLGRFMLAGPAHFARTEGGSDPFQLFEYIFRGQILAMMFIFILMIFYVVDVFKNKNLPDSKRSLWAVAILLGAPISMAVYWYHYVWKKPGSWS